MTLTPRELEVLRLRATGLPQKAVADRLRITEGTVKNISLAAFRKLGTLGLVDAMNTLGWVNLDSRETR